MEAAQINFLIQFFLNQMKVLNGIVERLEKIRPITEDKTNSLAYLIHNYYGCVEYIFKEVAKVFEEGGRFSQENYLKTLLLHASFEIKQVRPIIISTPTYHFLLEILKFRHVFRHAYNYILNPARVKENKVRVLENHIQLIKEFKIFTAFLESMLEN